MKKLSAALVMLVGLGFSAGSQAALLHFVGTYDGSGSALLNFTLNSSSDVQIWTDSYAAGNGDPAIVVTDSSNNVVGSNDNNDTFSPSQGSLDAGVSLPGLPGGDYGVTVNNNDNGNTQVGDGWSVWIDGADSASTNQGRQVPEPSSVLLLSLGMGLMLRLRRR